MVLGIKFSRMRMEDGFSSRRERHLLEQLRLKTGCWFYIRFWLTYWFAWPYFNYLASIGTEKASDFIEAFTFIMDMKDQVKLKLSLRQLSQVYHFIDPQTSKKDWRNEDIGFSGIQLTGQESNKSVQDDRIKYPRLQGGPDHMKPYLTLGSSKGHFTPRLSDLNRQQSARVKEEVFKMQR